MVVQLASTRSSGARHLLCHVSWRVCLEEVKTNYTNHNIPETMTTSVQKVCKDTTMLPHLEVWCLKARGRRTRNKKATTLQNIMTTTNDIALLHNNKPLRILSCCPILRENVCEKREGIRKQHSKNTITTTTNGTTLYVELGYYHVAPS